MARLGDDAAFEAIVGRYRSPLLGHCRRVAGGSNAHDALQQAFLSAWRALRSDCDVRDLRGWLFTIAHRSALQARREQDSRFGELPRTMRGTGSPAEDFEQSVRLNETLAAVAALPRLERDALVWTAVHGRSGRDAAHALGVSESTLRQLVFRARAQTRAAVHVFLPLPLLARLSHSARRVTAIVSSSPATCSPGTGGLLLKFAAVAAVGALLGSQLTIVPETGRRRPATSHTALPTYGTSARRAASTVRAAPRAAAQRSRHPSGAQVVRGAGAPDTHGTVAPAPHANTSAPSSVASSPAAARADPTRRQPVIRPTAGPPVAQVDAQPVVERVTAPIEQVTAPVRQITAPLREGVEGAVAQLPQTLASAGASVQTDAQQVTSVATAAIPDQGSPWVR
ncbi:MAG TPA: sigma-70 family RNA polymerase sigma factor [Solirubrobacteraceae bacterium]|nr:sigma-70 family RNA polymerase sigma factor [Solirubrobacteraceae bacterium]